MGEEKQKSFLRKFLDSANLVQQCRENGVGIWECPSFLFILIGFLDILITILIYFVASRLGDPIFTVLSLAVTNVAVMSIGMILIKAAEKVIKANQIRSEFVSIASHQLRAPLGNIRWAADLLENSRIGNLSEKQKEYIESIQINDKRMIKLLNDLLDVSKINTGTMIGVARTISLEEIVQQLVEEYNLIAKIRGVQLTLSVDDGLPMVTINPGRIKVAIQNLIDNAVKYSRNRGEIKISVSRLRNNVVLRIEDNGAGIPKDQQKDVFKKFFRSTNVKKYEVIGTGLGLFIARSAIESSGGKIWFTSEEDKGTVFYCAFPFEK